MIKHTIYLVIELKFALSIVANGSSRRFRTLNPN